MDYKIYGSIIVLILVILVIVFYYYAKISSINSTSSTVTNLVGLWDGEPSFLDESGLNKFQLLILPKVNGVFDGHLLIKNNNNEVLTDQSISIIVKKEANMNIIFSEEIIFPQNIKFKISMLDGSLSIFNRVKIYAQLYKNSKISNYINNQLEI